jgi:hypothetical protein
MLCDNDFIDSHVKGAQGVIESLIPSIQSITQKAFAQKIQNNDDELYGHEHNCEHIRPNRRGRPTKVELQKD